MSRHMTKLFVIILLLAALIGGSWYQLREPYIAEAPTHSQAKLYRGDISAVVSVTGTLNPINTVLVGSQVSGTIQHLSADFNDRVKQGQVIAQIDPAIFKAKLAEALANLKSAEAERDKAWISVLDANANTIARPVCTRKNWWPRVGSTRPVSTTSPPRWNTR